jgi:hypothetical protein
MQGQLYLTVEQGTSSEAYERSCGRKFPQPLWNPMVRRHVQNSGTSYRSRVTVRNMLYLLFHVEKLPPIQQEIFLFSMASRPDLGPIQPPIYWVWGPFSPGVKRPGRKAHLHLLSRSRILELYLHSPICLHGIALN